MSWGAVVGAAVSVVGGYMSNQSAKKGANAAADGQMASVLEQQRQYDQTRQDMMPWLDAGRQGLNQLSLLASGDMRGFYNSPEYAFTRDQGLQSLERGAAARGGLYSGGADADRMKFASGLASQEYGNHWNRLAGLAGVGQSTAQSLGGFGANAATNIGNAYGNIGNIRQSMYQQQGQNNAQMAGAVGGAFANWLGGRNG